MKRIFVLHPFFLAAYPVLFLLSHNIDQIASTQAVRPLTITISLAAILTFLFSFAAKDWHQGALSASLILVLFFSYGHVYRLLEKNVPAIANHALLGALWLLILSMGFLLKWRLKDFSTWTKALNLISFVLLIFPIFNIAVFLIQSGGTVEIERVTPWEEAVSISAPMSNEALPDIYYIIVDGYGRADLLDELFSYDNSDFIQYLESLGFYVAAKSHSNYVQTSLSLASSLNFEYIKYLSGVTGDRNRSREPLVELIQNSEIWTVLEAQGYQMVSFATGYEPTTIKDADIYIPYRPDIVNNLEAMLLTSSAARMLGSRVNNLFTAFSCEVQRGGILNIFEHLVQVPGLSGPQFVFAHIMSPHPPFVFDANGKAVQYGDCNGVDGDGFEGDRDDYQTGYPQQVAYVNSLLSDTIDQILSNSEIAPIIILQADHGSGMLWKRNSLLETCLRERTSILNAYYFPGHRTESLSDSITPVNSFRIVLNDYFGFALPLLDDKIYFSNWDQLYQFEDITDAIEDHCDLVP